MQITDHLVTKEVFQVNFYDQLECLKTNLDTLDGFEKYYNYDNYQSHNQDEKGLFNTIYKIAQKYNLNYKYNLLNNLNIREKKILDYGCGVGDFINKMNGEKWSAIGYEPNSQAQKILNRKKITTINSLDDLANESQEVITLWHVLEHISNPIEILNTLKTKLKPSGYFIIALPNYKSFDAKYYKNNWAAYDVPRHIYHFQKKSIKIISKKINMKYIKNKPLWLDAIYISMLSEKYKKSGHPIFGILIGTISNLLAIFTKEQSSIVYFLKKTK